jgi:hypothetical protein
LNIVELDTVVMCLTPGDVEEERKLMVQRLRDPRAARVLTRPDSRYEGERCQERFLYSTQTCGPVAFEKG